VFGIVLKTKAT